MQLPSPISSEVAHGSPSGGQEDAAGLADAQRAALLNSNLAAPTKAGLPGRPKASLRVAGCVVASALCYYFATQIAWRLCFPDSKVSLFFPPHAVLVSILLLVRTRHWWAYIVAAAGAHFVATQQADWPPLYALTCEAFDAAKAVAVAAAIRALIKRSPNALTLRDAILFILVAVVLIPFGAAFWGAAFTVSNGFGTRYWIEWRNLGISNAVTTVVLVPALLLGAYHLLVRRPTIPSSRRMMEAGILGAGLVAVGIVVFDHMPAGPGAAPPLLYACIPLLTWASLRFGLGGTSAAMLVITLLAIAGTMRGHGPFLTQTPTENALALQLFLLTTAAPLMLLAVVIEAERRTQAQVQQKRAQLEHLARVATLGELTATLTHELKQPLNAIRANSFAAIRFLDEPKPDLGEVRETLTDIGDITRRAGDMIQGLRDLLKRDTPGFTTVDVNQLIRSVERILHSDAIQHRVRVELDLSPTVAHVKGDSVQLQQVVLNLMLNGFQAMSDRALSGAPRRLTVRTDWINASNMLVEVRDNGTGVPADKLESIFEPFVTSKRDGLGMGLSICRSIIERHGGKLWAANNLDRGATFSITLPITQPGT